MEHVIAENGKSKYYIVVHRYADRAVRHAAAELQKYLLASTGAELPYFSDRCVKRGAEIRVGEKVRGHENDLSDLNDEGYVIREDGEDVVITGKTSRAVLYGVYRFLELFCGFRCFTKEVEKIDKKKRLVVSNVNLSEAPAFSYREAYFRSAFDGDFCVKNRLNGNMASFSEEQGGQVRWYNFHHALRDLVPSDRWYDTHPEYYSLNGGVRNGDGYTGQLCLTNPDVIRVAGDKLEEWIENNPACTVFSVAQNDNRNTCECPACRALEEKESAKSGPLVHFVNALADRISKKYPNVLLHTFAYQFSVPAPKHVRVRDNVITRLCTYSCRFDKTLSKLSKESKGEESVFTGALTAWGKIAKRLHVWDYCVNFSNYLQPFFHFHTMQKNVQYYEKAGVQGVMEQGNFAFGAHSAFDDLKVYVISRLLFDPTVNVDETVDEFLKAVYGKAAKILRRYIDLWETACSASPLTIVQNPDAAYITDKRIKKSERLFCAALLAERRPEILARIRREQLAVRYLKLAREKTGKAHDKRVEKFIRGVKACGMTEIMERTSLDVSEEILKSGNYAKNRATRYNVYYEMQ